VYLVRYPCLPRTGYATLGNLPTIDARHKRSPCHPDRVGGQDQRMPSATRRAGHRGGVLDEAIRRAGRAGTTDRMRVYDNGSRPELVVFDLDGTLYPRERYVDLVLDVIGRGLVELNGATSDAARSRVALLRAMMEENWDGTSTTAFVIAEGVDAAKWRDFRTQHLDIASGLTPDDRVVGHVARLRRHVPVALLTNNTRALTDQILQKIGFPGDAFDGVISAEDVGAHPKPSPAAFQTVVDRLGVPARNTWGIGDRYDIDIAPLATLGGAGVTVSGPTEIGGAVGLLIDRSVDVLDRQS